MLRRDVLSVRRPGDGGVWIGPTLHTGLQASKQAAPITLRVRGREMYFEDQIWSPMVQGRLTSLHSSELSPPLSPQIRARQSLEPRSMQTRRHELGHEAYRKSLALKDCTPSSFLSELHVAMTPEKVTCYVAAPGLTESDLHYAIDGHALCISNSLTPGMRQVLTFSVDAVQGVPVFAHPSLCAPIIGHRPYGERLRAFGPVHFWVALVQGEGCVRVVPAPGAMRGPLLPLGRPPLDASETAA